MIRLGTLICGVLAAAAGAYAFHAKDQTKLLDRAITQANRAIEATRERTGVLRAEWTLMNDPERLAELATQFLTLNTVAPRQFTTLADLSARLPAARALPAPTPETTTEEPATDAAEPIAEAPLPLPPPPAPPPALALAIPAPASNPAAPRPQPVAAPMSRQSAPSPSIESQTRSPTPAPRTVARTTPQPASQPIPLTPVMTGSALGMARSIVPPPIPITGQPAGRGDIQFTRGN